MAFQSVLVVGGRFDDNSSQEKLSKFLYDGLVAAFSGSDLDNLDAQFLDCLARPANPTETKEYGLTLEYLLCENILLRILFNPTCDQLRFGLQEALNHVIGNESIVEYPVTPSTLGRVSLVYTGQLLGFTGEWLLNDSAFSGHNLLLWLDGEAAMSWWPHLKKFSNFGDQIKLNILTPIAGTGTCWPVDKSGRPHSVLAQINARMAKVDISIEASWRLNGKPLNTHGNLSGFQGIRSFVDHVLHRHPVTKTILDSDNSSTGAALNTIRPVIYVFPGHGISSQSCALFAVQGFTALLGGSYTSQTLPNWWPMVKHLPKLDATLLPDWSASNILTYRFIEEILKSEQSIGGMLGEILMPPSVNSSTDGLSDISSGLILSPPSNISGPHHGTWASSASLSTDVIPPSVILYSKLGWGELKLQPLSHRSGLLLMWESTAHDIPSQHPLCIVLPSTHQANANPVQSLNRLVKTLCQIPQLSGPPSSRTVKSLTKPTTKPLTRAPISRPSKPVTNTTTVKETIVHKTTGTLNTKPMPSRNISSAPPHQNHLKSTTTPSTKLLLSSTSPTTAHSLKKPIHEKNGINTKQVDHSHGVVDSPQKRPASSTIDVKKSKSLTSTKSLGTDLSKSSNRSLSTLKPASPTVKTKTTTAERLTAHSNLINHTSKAHPRKSEPVSQTTTPNKIQTKKSGLSLKSNTPNSSTKVIKEEEEEGGGGEVIVTDSNKQPTIVPPTSSPSVTQNSTDNNLTLNDSLEFTSVDPLLTGWKGISQQDNISGMNYEAKSIPDKIITDSQQNISTGTGTPPSPPPSPGQLLQQQQQQRDQHQEVEEEYKVHKVILENKMLAEESDEQFTLELESELSQEQQQNIPQSSPFNDSLAEEEEDEEDFLQKEASMMNYQQEQEKYDDKLVDDSNSNINSYIVQHEDDRQQMMENISPNVEDDSGLTTLKCDDVAEEMRQYRTPFDTDLVEQEQITTKDDLNESPEEIPSQVEKLDVNKCIEDSINESLSDVHDEVSSLSVNQQAIDEQSQYSVTVVDDVTSKSNVDEVGMDKLVDGSQVVEVEEEEEGQESYTWQNHQQEQPMEELTTNNLNISCIENNNQLTHHVDSLNRLQHNESSSFPVDDEQIVEEHQTVEQCLHEDTEIKIGHNVFEPDYDEFQQQRQQLDEDDGRQQELLEDLTVNTQKMINIQNDDYINDGDEENEEHREQEHELPSLTDPIDIEGEQTPNQYDIIHQLQDPSRSLLLQDNLSSSLGKEPIDEETEQLQDAYDSSVQKYQIEDNYDEQQRKEIQRQLVSETNEILLSENTQLDINQSYDQRDEEHPINDTSVDSPFTDKSILIDESYSLTDQIKTLESMNIDDSHYVEEEEEEHQQSYNHSPQLSDNQNLDEETDIKNVFMTTNNMEPVNIEDYPGDSIENQDKHIEIEHEDDNELGKSDIDETETEFVIQYQKPGISKSIDNVEDTYLDNQFMMTPTDNYTKEVISKQDNNEYIEQPFDENTTILQHTVYHSNDHTTSFSLDTELTPNTAYSVDSSTDQILTDNDKQTVDTFYSNILSKSMISREEEEEEEGVESTEESVQKVDSTTFDESVSQLNNQVEKHDNSYMLEENSLHVDTAENVREYHPFMSPDSKISMDSIVQQCESQQHYDEQEYADEHEQFDQRNQDSEANSLVSSPNRPISPNYNVVTSTYQHDDDDNGVDTTDADYAMLCMNEQLNRQEHETPTLDEVLNYSSIPQQSYSLLPNNDNTEMMSIISPAGDNNTNLFMPSPTTFGDDYTATTTTTTNGISSMTAEQHINGVSALQGQSDDSYHLENDNNLKDLNSSVNITTTTAHITNNDSNLLHENNGYPYTNGYNVNGDTNGYAGHTSSALKNNQDENHHNHSNNNGNNSNHGHYLLETEIDGSNITNFLSKDVTSEFMKSSISYPIDEVNDEDISTHLVTTTTTTTPPPSTILSTTPSKEIDNFSKCYTDGEQIIQDIHYTRSSPHCSPSEETFDPVKQWGQPLGLPAPVAPSTNHSKKTSVVCHFYHSS
ncbi:unnamed protein product [Heterobilharzia americana]|nr:unnamed protein product [Heterobilharzia americana]